MPGGRTKFQNTWLETVDKNKDKIGSWCTQGSNEYEAYCILCNTPFSISNSGRHQILSHSSKQKHVQRRNSVKGSQSILGTQNQTGDAASNLCLQLNLEQQVTKAETIWCLKVASSNFSFASCSKDITDVFQTIFPNNPVANKMQLSERKISYIISHGLAKYFDLELTKEIRKCIVNRGLYSISFGETTTTHIKNNFDVFIKFWSLENKIKTAYLSSDFLGHADAVTIKHCLLTMLQNKKLPLDRLLMLSMDGPNVNKAVLKNVNKELQLQGTEELVTIAL